MNLEDLIEMYEKELQDIMQMYDAKLISDIPKVKHRVEALAIQRFIGNIKDLNVETVSEESECSHPSTYWYFGDESHTIKHCANCGAKNIHE